jgi:hypothetical protein
MHDEFLARKARIRADHRAGDPPFEGLSAQRAELREESIGRRGRAGQMGTAGEGQRD